MNPFKKENIMIVAVCLLCIGVGVGLVLLAAGSRKSPDAAAEGKQLVVDEKKRSTQAANAETQHPTVPACWSAPTMLSLLGSDPVVLPLGMRLDHNAPFA